MKKIIYILILILTNNLGAEYYGYGINNISNIDKLPLRRNFGMIYQESSHDKKGGNCDGWCYNFLYLDDNKDKVVFESNTPGKILRIWETGLYGEDYLNFYFNGESIPSKKIKVNELFYSNNKSFPYPLVLNYENNSGACISYVDITYNSLRITTNGDGYFEFETVQLPFKLIENNKFNEINEDIILKLKNVTINPNNNRGKEENISIGKIAIDSSIQLFNFEKSGIINGIYLSFKGIETAAIYKTVKDDGRSHQGKSSFKSQIPKNTKKIKLIKRYDSGACDEQNALVKINNKEIGIWRKFSYDQRYRWKDIEFNINTDKLINDDSTKFEFIFNSKNIYTNWNEFFYWVFADDKLVDSIDIGNLESEKIHQYSIENQLWSGTQFFNYFIKDTISKKRNDILKNTYISIYIDDLEKPTINAPLDLFFGVGDQTAITSKSLMFGFDNITKMLYNFFPIPYSKNIQILLYNNSYNEIENLHLTINLAPNNFATNSYGFLNTFYSINKDSSKDYTIFNEKSSGHIVGIINNYSNHEHDRYLESDERFYINNLKTPNFYGTGTDDFFNSGFYFNRGIISNPLNGLSDQLYSDRTLYRILVNDPIIYQNGAMLNFEKVGNYDSNTEIRSLVFYYSDDKPSILLSDSIILNDINSRNIHQYINKNEKIDNIFSSFEGTYDYLKEEYHGFMVDESEFNLLIDPKNNGTYITRIYNYTYENQKAEVFADDIFAGIWFNPGKNDSIRLREDLFFIKPELTKNKSKINLKIKKLSKEWSESKYYIYNNLVEDIDFTDTNNNIDKSTEIEEFYPNPANNYSKIDLEKINNFELIDIFGNNFNIEGRITSNGLILALEKLNNGLYFVKINTTDGTKVKKLLVFNF